jgi:hypothetical protein
VKSVKIALTILFILSVLALSGCNKTYFFSFKDEQALVNDEGAWFMEGDFDWAFTSKGLTMSDNNVASPFRYSGDFSYIVSFYLNADEEHLVSFGICLGDGTWYGTTENDVHIEFYNPNSEHSAYYIEDHDDMSNDYVHYDEQGDPPGLNPNGYNLFRLVKKGDCIQIFLNDVEYAKFELQTYNSEWFGPNIWSDTDFGIDDGYGFFLESVAVVHPTGNVSDMPIY